MTKDQLGRLQEDLRETSYPKNRVIQSKICQSPQQSPLPSTNGPNMTQRCSIPSASRKMKMKTTLRDHLTPIRMAFTQKYVEKKTSLHTNGENVN